MMRMWGWPQCVAAVAVWVTRCFVPSYNALEAVQARVALPGDGDGGWWWKLDLRDLRLLQVLVRRRLDGLNVLG